MAQLQAFIETNKLVMTATRCDSNPIMENSDNMDHWRCRIKNNLNGNRMRVVFSMDTGHRGKQPTLADVLDCLTSEAASVDSARSFDDWCSEYGCDTDSRKAERTYNACVKQASDLASLLGEQYRVLLYHTERQ